VEEPRVLIHTLAARSIGGVGSKRREACRKRGG
jgi:hypothetical protein